MSIHSRRDTVAMTAAFLYKGMSGYGNYGLSYTRFIEAHGGGMIELVDSLTCYAPLIATIFDNETRDFPGVFHYEVSEQFGAWFAESLHATGRLPDSLLGIKKICELVEAFFSQGGRYV